jgi:prepilin-type N-terminal cleavage/methylation domain-containing protein
MNASTYVRSTSDRSRRSRRRSGFSLMELMIVVVITSVLAAIAIPTFSGYIQKSRTSEAVDFLGVIKLRQESYRSEFGQYYRCNATDPAAIASADFVPGDASTMKNAVTQPFPDDNACFNALGAKPGGFVRFGYAWAAGLPSEAASVTTMSSVYGMSASTYDHYFVARAITDLDGDGTVCTYELTSFTRNVWFSPDTGWE